MKTFQVFLVDATNEHQKLLGKRLQNPESIKFAVTRADLRDAEAVFKDSVSQIDIVVIGSTITPSSVLQLSKMFRSYSLAVPIFVLTKNGGTRIPRSYRNAGIDDMMNVAEMGTPLFAWSFISSVEQVVLKKKAKEYDVLYNRLRTVNASLATFVHEINNPLSVIRLALYHLEKPELPRQKRETFFKLLLDNLERIDVNMKTLTAIRRHLGGEKAVRAKVLSLKIKQRAAAQ